MAENKYYPNTGGYIAAKSTDAYAREPERYLDATKGDVNAYYSADEVEFVAKNLSTTHSGNGFASKFQKAFETLVTESGDNWWLISKAIDAQDGTNFFAGIQKIEKMVQDLENKMEDLGIRLSTFAQDNLDNEIPEIPNYD